MKSLRVFETPSLSHNVLFYHGKKMHNFSQNEMRPSIHPGLAAHGLSENGQLSFSGDLMPYIHFFLKDEPSLLPRLNKDQWLKLFSILISHRIFPLAFWKINSSTMEFVPPKQINYRMRIAFLRNSIRCFRIEKQLRELIEAFKDEGIRALVLRGPGLAWSVYPNPALRPFDDLDLLVLPEQMIKARAVMEKLGYKSLNKKFILSRDFYREENFIHDKKPADHLLVDLHWENWELYPFFRRNGNGIEELFERAVRIESSPLSFETLHPVDSLIHSAIHLTVLHKQSMRLIWIYDIALLAARLQGPTQWEELKERSVAWLARLAVETSLKMAHTWVGLRLPERFEDFSDWPQPTADEAMVWSHSIDGHWMRVLLKKCLSSPSGLLKIARSLFHLLFPHPDIMRYCYPASSNWLLCVSYVKRWHRWLVQLISNQASSSGRGR